MQYIIPLPPVTKKNSQRIMVNKTTGKPFIMPSAKYLQYEQAARCFLCPPSDGPINYPVNVRCMFYMPSRRKADLTNLLEAADDLLVAAGILADDSYNIVAGHDGSRCLVDKDNPRTEITITREA